MELDLTTSQHWTRLLRPRRCDLTPENRSRVNVRILGNTGDRTCQRGKHTAEEIINKLREAEVIIATGSTVAEASRRIGVSEQTFYRWRAEYGGLRVWTRRGA